MKMPKTQRKLLKSVARVNENVTVVLFTGRPLDIREVKRYAKAILVVWMPGTEGGNAIARVLYGKTSPSGKLPMSFPYCVGQVPVFYGEFRTGRYRQGADPENRFVSRYLDIPSDPLYPFGYGLSYSSFTCSKVTLSGNRLCRDGSLEASVILKNTGTVKAKEVVQMYLSDLAGSVVRPVRELKGFQKLCLEPGEEKKVSFEITEELLHFYGKDGKRQAEPGAFRVYIGTDSKTENGAEFTFE